MADIDLIQISDLDPLNTPNDSVVIPIEVGGETYKLSLADLKAFLFSNTTLTGTPVAPSPGAGVDNQQLATTNYVQTELSGLGLGAATASTPGVVRTNTTDPAPIVYLKTEIDAFNSTVQSVALGGTGATTAADARTNLAAAQSGSNSDITSLTALASVPSIITTTYADGANMPIGTLLMTAANSVPSTRWMFCDGTLLLIADYPTLYARIGTAWGGNGTTNFNLPDFRGRSPLGAGVSAASGTNRAVGTTGGADTHTLTIGQIPAHNHSVSVFWASTGGGTNLNVTTAAGSVHSYGPVQSQGSGQSHNNLHPFAAVNFMIKVS